MILCIYVPLITDNAPGITTLQTVFTIVFEREIDGLFFRLLYFFGSHIADCNFTVHGGPTGTFFSS